MDNDYFVKLFEINVDGKGVEAMAILNMSAFFAPGDIRIGIFTPLIPDRTQRKAAVGILQRLSLVRTGSKENHFFISDSTQAAHREFLKDSKTDGRILENTISLMKALNRTLGGYPHFLSVYNHAKKYPLLLEQLDTLPANIVSGMNQCGKPEDALKFGKDCEDFFAKSFGKYHKTVMSLQTAMGAPLIELKKVDEAIKVSLDVLQKASDKLEINFIIESIMLLAEAIIKNNPLGPMGAEAILRETVFNGKNVFDTCSDWELEKWFHYAQLISRFGLTDTLTDTAISILRDVIEQRLRIFGPDNDKLWEVKFTIAERLSADSRVSKACDLLWEIDMERAESYGEMHESRLQIKYEIGMVTKKEGNLKKSMDILRT